MLSDDEVTLLESAIPLAAQGDLNARRSLEELCAHHKLTDTSLLHTAAEASRKLQFGPPNGDVAEASGKIIGSIDMNSVDAYNAVERLIEGLGGRASTAGQSINDIPF